MATVICGPKDDTVKKICEALDAYEGQYPGAEAKLYRQNAASIRLRIVDRRFEGMGKSRRHDQVWRFLCDRVGEDVMGDVSLLLLLPPAELGTSLMNLEFEQPLKSNL